MAAKKKDNPKAGKTARGAKAAAHELGAAVWSVISFDRREAGGLTYRQAEAKLAELEAARISGLCIVTDRSAARIGR